MKKIPVLATIRDAYNFIFTHLGAIIGLIWLPMILMTVIGFFVMQRFLEAYAVGMVAGNYANMGPETLAMLFFIVASLLLFTMMSVPVTQLALGTRKQGALVHFVFGATEWRLFRGIMGLVGFLLVPMLVLSALTGLAETGALGAAGASLVPLLYLLFLLSLIYFGLRFGMLLPAVAVSESVPLLPRTWILSAGNFWRMLVVAAAIFLPIEIISAILHLALEGKQAMMPQAQLATAVAAAARNMPLTSGINFLLAPLLLGLNLGAGASIYRTLTNGRDELAIPPPSTS